MAHPVSRITWRFMGSYKWGYKCLNMGYIYSYPSYNYPKPETLNPTYKYTKP